MRLRLISSYLTVTVVALLLLVYPLGRTFAAREHDRLLRDIERDATVVAALVEDSLEGGAAPDLGTLLVAYAADPGGRIVVVDRSGRAVADSQTPGEIRTSFANRPEIAAALAGQRAEGTRRSQSLGASLVYVAVPVASGGVVHGAVRITYGTDTLDRRVRTNWLRLAALSGLVLVADTAVGLVLTAGVTGPVRRLESAARALASGDLAARAPDDRGAPELRQLATTFNETAGRLEQVLDAQRSFVADASHQLRTPLAALRLQLENLEAALPATDRGRVAPIVVEVSRLGRLADGLLALTRSASTRAAPVAVDVAAVAAERADRWGPVASEGGVALVVDGPSPLWARAEPGALEQILDNLIANALDVAPPGSSVQVLAHPEPGRVAVHVVDRGPGLDEDSRRRAFDRFWRAPDASPGGSGIGLAIVRQLARSSGGNTELRAVAGGGIDAVVTLPVAVAAGPTQPGTRERADRLPGAHLARSGR
jgi:signal transduction histidine kinase